jgi:lipoyl(octanoyl) transferase
MVEVLLRDLGRTSYKPVFADMRAFTDARSKETLDELWLTEHEPVFTQGQAGKEEHLLMPGDIPVVQSDRGGQVTYHGPGQIVGYLMFDLRRLGLGVRDLVSGIERSMIDTLAGYGIEAAARPDAPGVYVNDAKIGSLGLRVRRGCSYHGLALNVNMDLEPFSRINPCGLTDTAVTQIADLGGPGDLDQVRDDLLTSLAAVYGVSLRRRGNSDPSAA